VNRTVFLIFSLKIYSRPISTDQLNPLRGVHFPPINLVVYKGSKGIPYLGVGLALQMLSALIPKEYSYPACSHQ